MTQMPVPEKNPKFSILFVDDEEQARKYFARALRKEFNVLTADSVRQARQMLSLHGAEIGVLITDQRMPEELGVELLKHARTEYPHIIRMLTTAYSDLEDAIAAVNSGEILRYITKPWNIVALTSELRHAMHFFEIQQDRDQLLQEKMHIRQRMSAINQVRDLIIIAASLVQYQRSEEAVRSMLTQIVVSNTLLSDGSKLDMWEQFEDEVNTSINIIEQIKQAARYLSVTVTKVDIGAILKQALTSDPAVNYTFPAAPTELETMARTVCRITEILSEQLNSRMDHPPVNINIRQHQNAVTVEFRGASPEQTPSILINTELIIAFLLTYHIGGELIVMHDGQHGFNLVLPVNTDKIESKQPEADWMDRILCQYEQ